MSNNNEANGLAIGLAFLAIGMIAIASVVFAIGLFLAVILTLWSFYAWNKPRTLFGETTTPEDARGFVYRGLAGMVILPVFVAFAAAILHLTIKDQWWSYLILSGYVLGSVGIGIQIAKAKAEAMQQEAAMLALLPPEQPMRAVRMIDAQPPMPTVQEAQQQKPAPQAERFRFATWDDEEELRK